MAWEVDKWMEPVQRLGKEALVSGAEGADGVDEVDVTGKVVQGTSHRVHIRPCPSRTLDALHRREKQGVRAAAM